ncbi:MAG: UDP-N-acetylmuramate--L-alanine ligase, partial [Flavobacteriales bacterium]
GIGGIGMSALARYFNNIGWQVAGYDRTSTSLTDALIKEGIPVYFEDKIELIPEFITAGNKMHIVVVFTPAVPAEHKQKNYFLQHGFETMKRSEVLGELAAEGTCIAVAGTHGKTTTTTLIAHILYSNQYPCNAFLGGISTNYNTNLLLDSNAACNVVEADEFDRSFLRLFPTLAVVTSMDADHLDIYGNEESVHKSYNEFVQQVKSNGKVIYKLGLPLKVNVSSFTYSLSDNAADYTVSEISIKNGEYYYTIHYPGGKINNVKSGLPGRHNVENALAAFAAAHQLGIEISGITNAISTYQGVKRRFEYIIKNNNLVYIDDYAHHPAELTACISSVKEMYPGKNITGIFQPHLFTRTRDFAMEFAKSLELLDRIILLDIYPARELPIDGVTANMLLKQIKNENKIVSTKEALIPELKKNRPQVLLTLGAGDIDKLVEPIKKGLLQA